MKVYVVHQVEWGRGCCDSSDSFSIDSVFTNEDDAVARMAEIDKNHSYGYGEYTEMEVQ